MDDRNCVVCGELFTPTQSNQICCPPTEEDRAKAKGQPRSKCARRYMNSRQRGTPLKHGKVGQPFQCEWCGRLCTPGEDVAPHATKFCSQKHKAMWHHVHREGRPTPIERAARRLGVEAGTPRSFTAGHCRNCDETFVSRGDCGRYCSDACRDEYRHRLRRDAVGEQGEHHWSKLVERDEGRCGICGDLVDLDVRAPSHLAPTVDHIIPISRGGDHDESNLQLAHFICNSRKRDVVIDRAATSY